MYEDQDSTIQRGIPCPMCQIAKGIEIESDHIMIKSYSLGDDGYYHEQITTPVTVQKIVTYTCSDCGSVLVEADIEEHGHFV